jgi:drug/metabolite transporter (DMT)-like permease
MDRHRTKGLLLVTTGTLMWSLAGLFVRATDLPVWDLIFWRSVFASLCLAVVAFARRRGPGAFGLPGLLGAVLAALAMFGYVAALRLTTVANVLVIYATLPFMSAGLAWLVSREQIHRRALIASSASLTGVVCVAGTALHSSSLPGTALAVAMTLCFAALLLVARKFPRTDIALINAAGSALCALATLPMTSGEIPGARDLLLTLGLGVFTTALAFLLFLMGSRRLASAEAAMICLLDVVFGPVWVWIAFSENPGAGALFGGAIVLGSVAWYLWPALRRQHPPPAEPGDRQGAVRTRAGPPATDLRDDGPATLRNR